METKTPEKISVKHTSNLNFKQSVTPAAFSDGQAAHKTVIIADCANRNNKSVNQANTSKDDLAIKGDIPSGEE